MKPTTRGTLARLGNMSDDCALIQAWATHLKARNLAERTIQIRAYYVTRLARLHPLRAVTLDILESILAGHDYAPETLKSIRASWRGFYAWAHRSGHLDNDPTIDLAPIRVPVTIPHLAPDDDIAAAVARSAPRERAMLLLARLACLRLAELTSLHTDDRAGRWIEVTGKGSKQRRVFLHPDLATALDVLERAQGRGWYFPGERGHLHPQSVHKIIIRACGHNPHSLRHAGATAAYRTTRDLRAVQMMLGHSSMAVTQRYLHVDDDGLQAVAMGAALAA